MRRGLFGKLQSKRDFVVYGAPRSFLAVFEPWIQGCVASSRAQLGADWQAAFLTAPIWRFWLGPQICGTTALGAVMPSMDGVGRYFPLSLALLADEGEALPPPEADPQDEWFAAVEDFLLSTLEREAPFEAILRAFEALPAPAFEGAQALILPRGVAAARVDEKGFAAACRAARESEERVRATATMSFWWTDGGQGFERLALVASGMPDPSVFAAMISAQRDPPAEVDERG